MTKHRRAATTRSVPAETPERLLELTQEHIRPLIGLIDRQKEAGADDELSIISKHPRRLSCGVQPFSSDKYPQERLGPPRQQHGFTRFLLPGAYVPAVSRAYLSRKLSRPLPTKDG